MVSHLKVLMENTNRPREGNDGGHYVSNFAVPTSTPIRTQSAGSIAQCVAHILLPGDPRKLGSKRLQVLWTQILNLYQLYQNLLLPYTFQHPRSSTNWKPKLSDPNISLALFVIMGARVPSLRAWWASLWLQMTKHSNFFSLLEWEWGGQVNGISPFISQIRCTLIIFYHEK